MNRLTDERLNTLEFTAEECMDGQVRFDIMALCEELRARRERDADLWALIADYAMWDGSVFARTNYGTPEQVASPMKRCAALLAHFGLAEPEVEK